MNAKSSFLEPLVIMVSWTRGVSDDDLWADEGGRRTEGVYGLSLAPAVPWKKRGVMPPDTCVVVSVYLLRSRLGDLDLRESDLSLLSNYEVDEFHYL